MKLKLTIFLCLAAMALSGSGCSLFHKSDKPKENKAIASEVEANFQQLWIERNTAALVAGGADPAAARAQAEREFAQKFPYLVEPKK